MDTNFLKEIGFDESQMKQISQSEYIVIRNFFNSQEIANSEKKQIIEACKMLSPIFSKLKIVNMTEYISKTKASQGNETALAVDPKLAQVDSLSQEEVISDGEGVGEDEDSKSKFLDRYIKGRYLVQQVWILEFLINNPNLLTANENVEIAKRVLREKEMELKLHNFFLNKFFEMANNIDNIPRVLNFKHFGVIKKDINARILEIQKDAPINFKGMVEILIRLGLEDREDLNRGICSVLAKLISDHRLQKLLKYTEENFKEVDISYEKKKFLRKTFKQ